MRIFDLTISPEGLLACVVTINFLISRFSSPTDHNVTSTFRSVCM